MLLEPAKFKAIETVATRRTRAKTGYSPQEITLLFYLHGYLSLQGKTICSEVAFLHFITPSPKERSKLAQHMYFCMSKRLIGSYEFIRLPGSKCLGLSDLGCSVLLEYYNQINYRLRQANAKEIKATVQPAEPKDLYHFRQVA
jgi:hypothetical protein